jgi:4-diphosphocytidyl-2-C-methyl-D-erythritol kinase
MTPELDTELAPAKVNLTLHVTGQRADGYHLLDSLVVFTAVGDVLALSGAPGLTLTGPEAAGLRTEPDNLVLRAARLVGAEDAGLVLDKRLPVASGIGGGSSDAAATLRLLARARGLPLPDEAATLALGADVPVCMAARPTRMQGVGEVLSGIPPLPPFWLVLVNPRQGVSTPAVFRGLTRRDGAPMALPDGWRDLPDFAAWLARQRNDLEAPAAALCPDIGTVLAALGAQPDCMLARMSGSGATCFGLFASQTSAEHAAQVLQSAQPAWWVCATALLGAA